MHINIYIHLYTHICLTNIFNKCPYLLHSYISLANRSQTAVFLLSSKFYPQNNSYMKLIFIFLYKSKNVLDSGIISMLVVVGKPKH